MTNPPLINLHKMVLENGHYRRVLQTTSQMQVVTMSLQPDDFIPEETHEGDQFIVVLQGEAYLKIDNDGDVLRPGESVMIQAGKRHYLKAIGLHVLKLYTIYSPPEHPYNRVEDRVEK